MHLKCFCLLLCLATATAAHARESLNLSARAGKITVYNRGAELDHRASVQLQPGSTTVVISGVARNLEEKSLNVGTNAGVTVLSVKIDKENDRNVEDADGPGPLKDSLKVLRRLRDRLANEQDADKKVLDLLERNSSIGKSGAGVEVTALAKMADYYQDKQISLTNHMDELQERMDELTKLSAVLEQRLGQCRKEAGLSQGRLVIQLMSERTVTCEINISYYTPDAGWVPLYNLSAESVSEPLHISYKAKVSQQTGIDWTGVILKLVTGNPRRGNTAPELTPWFLRLEQPLDISGYKSDKELYAEQIQTASGGGQPGANPDIQIRGRNSLSPGAQPVIILDGAVFGGSLTDINPNDVASMSILKDAEAAGLYGSRSANGVVLVTTKGKSMSGFVTASEERLHTAFEVAIPYDIASGDQPKVVSLKEYTLPVTYEYMAIPGADEDAFLIAGLTGYERLGLLPGEANIVFANTYVGSSYINPGITGDTLKLSMGRDRMIHIDRKRIAELSSAAFIGGRKKQETTWEIQLRNTRQEPVTISLKDRYPKSMDKEIVVELLQQDGAVVDEETHIMTWNIYLRPGETKKLRFSYSVKYPKGAILAGM